MAEPTNHDLIIALRKEVEEMRAERAWAKAEKEKRRMRQQVFDVEDEIADKRDAMIDALEQRLHRSSKAENLFVVRWQLV